MVFEISHHPKNSSHRSRIVGLTPVILRNFFHMVALNRNEDGIVNLDLNPFALEDYVIDWLANYTNPDECYIEYRSLLTSCHDKAHTTLGFYFLDPKIA